MTQVLNLASLRHTGIHTYTHTVYLAFSLAETYVCCTCWI